MSADAELDRYLDAVLRRGRWETGRRTGRQRAAQQLEDLIRRSEYRETSP